MIQAKNITKAYDQVQVLKGIDISVKEGELISIVGASGAGKTTLLQILGTLERPDAGEYSVGTQLPFELSQKQLAQFRNESIGFRSEEHTSELQSRPHLVCRLLLEKKNKK